MEVNGPSSSVLGFPCGSASVANPVPSAPGVRLRNGCKTMISIKNDPFHRFFTKFDHSSVTEERSSVTEERSAATEACSSVAGECSAITEERAVVTAECSSVTESAAGMTKECSAGLAACSVAIAEAAGGVPEWSAVVAESAGARGRTAAGLAYPYQSWRKSARSQPTRCASRSARVGGAGRGLRGDRSRTRLRKVGCPHRRLGNPGCGLVERWLPGWAGILGSRGARGRPGVRLAGSHFPRRISSPGSGGSARRGGGIPCGPPAS